MMDYTAIYSTEIGGNYRNMTDSSYSSKESFRKDLVANGYRVAGIFTPDKIAEIKSDDEALINNLGISARIISYIKECM